MSQPIQETGDSQTKNATPGGLDPSFLGMTQKIGGVAKNQVRDASVAKNQFSLRHVSQEKLVSATRVADTNFKPYTYMV